MYRANGALFSTIETVAGENPLCVATSLIVTAWPFSLGRFTRMAPSELHHCATLMLIANHVKRSRLLCRRIEGKRAAKPIRLPNAESNACNHPDASHNLRRA